MRTHRLRALAFVIAGMTAFAASHHATLYAQGVQTCSLSGRVTDSTRAVLPGTLVTIESPDLIGGPRAVESDEHGYYAFPTLPPGIYAITVSRNRFRTATRRDVKLLVGTGRVIDFALDLGSMADRIDVHAQPQLVDVRSSAAPTNLDEKLLEHLPTVRNITALLNLMPGVNREVAFGAPQATNALTLEGSDITSPGTQEQWSFINYNWIREVQLVALGAGAEYGETTGATANVVLRSGTNQLSGLSEFLTTRQQWVGNNLPKGATLGNALEVLHDWVFNAQLGGPILKDRLWFFGGYEAAESEVRPAGFSGPGTNTDGDHVFIVRLEASPANAVRLDGFVTRSKIRNEAFDIGPFRPLEIANDYNHENVHWNGKIGWVPSSHTLVEGRYTGLSGFGAFDPHPPNSRFGPSSHYDIGLGVDSVNTCCWFESDRSRHAVGASLTHYVDGRFGKAHEFKIGLEHERTRARDLEGIPGGRTYLDLDGNPWRIVMWDGQQLYPRGHVTSAYVRDRWEVSDRLTIEPGIRLDANRGSVPLKGQVFRTTPVSPRLGAAWDVLGDHRTVVRGHYGRYHDAFITRMFRVLDFSASPPFIQLEVTGPDEFREVSRNEKPLDTRTFDRNLRHPRVDQILIGAERQIVGQFAVQANYIRRHFDSAIAYVLRTSPTWVPVQAQDPGPDGRVGTPDDGGQITVYTGAGVGNTLPPLQNRTFANASDATRTYDGVQIIARKRWDQRWEAQASYTWSRTYGTLSNEHDSQQQTDGTFGTGGSPFPNDAVNGKGRVTFDSPQELKILGTYRLPLWGGFNMSGVYRYVSGTTYSRFAFLQGDWGYAFVRVEPRGSRRLPAENILDLRAEKTGRVPGTRMTAGFFVDVFNLTNQGIPLAAYQTSGEDFGKPALWSEPRTARAAVRVMF